MPESVDIHWLREREDHVATQGFMGGVALGILLGVVLALVFAPRRGDETRAAVAHVAHEAREKTAQFVTRTSSSSEDSGFGDLAAIEREFGPETDPTVTS